MIAAEGESFFLFSDNGARLENGNQAALIFDTKTGVVAAAYTLSSAPARSARPFPHEILLFCGNCCVTPFQRNQPAASSDTIITAPFGISFSRLYCLE
ncbi:hypothetical protein ACLFK3_00215 [Bacillus siamensis]|uniref:hypothetical protein n=1 Tax=Bacillus siamensis TaxID=659243 RepID=UPI0039E86375